MASDSEKPAWLKKIENTAQKRAQRLVDSGIRTEDPEIVYEELREALLELHYEKHPEDRDVDIAFDDTDDTEEITDSQEETPAIQAPRNSDTIKSGPTIIPPPPIIPPASPLPGGPTIPPSRSTPIQVSDRRGIIVIQTHNKQRLQTPEMDRAYERTREYRSMVRDAGMFTLSAEEQAELSDLHPTVDFSGTDVSTAANLSILGINTDEFGRKIKSSNVLTRAEENRLININEILKILQAADAEMTKDLREVNLYPQIVIERRDPITAPLPDSSGALALNPIGNTVQPLLNVATSEAKKRASKAITNKITKKITKEVVKKTASTAAAEAGAAAGSVVPVVGNLIGAAVGWLVGSLAAGAVDYLSKRTDDLKNLAGGIIIGGGQAIGWIVGALWAATVGIGSALGIALISIPIVIAFILFIINTSAWVVPPWYGNGGPFPGGDPSGEIDSAFIEVDKVANPFYAENEDLPLTVTYTVTVAAEQSALTNIIFSETCMTIQEGGSPACPPPTNIIAGGVSTDEFPPTAPASIAPASPYIITYDRVFPAGIFEDTLVIDTFTVTADAEGLVGEISASTATVTIGSPPGPASCPSSGSDITALFATRIPGGYVDLLPDDARNVGECITPTMLVIHWSADGSGSGYEGGNDQLWHTLGILRKLSCQFGTDTDNAVVLMPLYENQTELPSCVGVFNGIYYNNYGVNIEMSGEWFYGVNGEYIDAEGRRYFNAVNPTELQITYSTACEIMKQYNIPSSQIYGHYELNPTNPDGSIDKSDPGDQFLHTLFIPTIEALCEGKK